MFKIFFLVGLIFGSTSFVVAGSPEPQELKEAAFVASFGPPEGLLLRNHFNPTDLELCRLVLESHFVRGILANKEGKHARKIAPFHHLRVESINYHSGRREGKALFTRASIEITKVFDHEGYALVTAPHGSVLAEFEVNPRNENLLRMSDRVFVPTSEPESSVQSSVYPQLVNANLETLQRSHQLWKTIVAHGSEELDRLVLKVTTHFYINSGAANPASFSKVTGFQLVPDLNDRYASIGFPRHLGFMTATDVLESSQYVFRELDQMYSRNSDGPNHVHLDHLRANRMDRALLGFIQANSRKAFRQNVAIVLKLMKPLTHEALSKALEEGFDIPSFEGEVQALNLTLPIFAAVWLAGVKDLAEVVERVDLQAGFDLATLSTDPIKRR